ncbi:hypothetical protein AAG570_008522 [Ranatra chinensis]|uniref:Uncharacterized protein n=1 Tax=Ranatra chinensis TaxID=642074 RepID=A0ABD0ZCA9_9HEMI
MFSAESLYLALAACHVTAMSSAVSNPVVYGFLNSNIRHELCQLLPAKCALAPQGGAAGGARTDDPTLRTLVATTTHNTRRESAPTTALTTNNLARPHSPPPAECTQL